MVLVVVLGVSVVVGSRVAANADSVTSTEDWRARMASMLKNVIKLVPLVMNDVKFGDPQNQAKIKQAVHELALSSANLEAHAKKGAQGKGPGADPALSAGALGLKEAFDLADVVLATGQSDQAKMFVRQALNQCLSCHSETNAGQKFQNTFLRGELERLSPLDRFTIFAATRQFDAALSEFTTLAQKPGSSSAIEFEETVRSALAISVRVKQDPQAALKILDDAARSGRVSGSFKRSIEGWKAAVSKWFKETSDQPPGEPALFAKAEELMKEARRREDKTESYDASQIELLRASGLLHRFVREFPQSPLRTEAYFDLGSIYEEHSVSGPAWDVANNYFEACVRTRPHSQKAQTCFEKYNDNMLFGYTGSAGTRVPAEVRAQIEKLSSLAKPESKKE